MAYTSYQKSIGEQQAQQALSIVRSGLLMLLGILIVAALVGVLLIFLMLPVEDFAKSGDFHEKLGTGPRPGHGALGPGLVAYPTTAAALAPASGHSAVSVITRFAFAADLDVAVSDLDHHPDHRRPGPI
jgi:hypothetical protein